MNAFNKFWVKLIIRIKPNKAKCEIAGIGALKWVSLAPFGIDCIDLTKKQ